MHTCVFRFYWLGKIHNNFTKEGPFVLIEETMGA